MPHISIDYSANLDATLDIQGLCNTLRDVTAALEIFPANGVRVRAFRTEHYAIADSHPDNAFIDISVRLREGRPLEVRQHATKAIFAAATTFLADLIDTTPIMVSLEMRNIDAALAPKLNTIQTRAKGTP